MLSRQPIYSATMGVAAYELRTQGPEPTAEGLWKAIPKSRVMLGYFHDFPPSSVTAQLLSKTDERRLSIGSVR